MPALGSGRSDGDSWDLASGVGVTATMVAAGRALASRGPEALIDDRFAEPLVRAVGLDFFDRLLDGDVAITEDDSTFGDRHRREQIAVRTRFFDDFFLDAVGAGLRQVVILASGLDSRAYRLAWPDGTVVFEVDQPEVVKFKTATLARLGEQASVDHRPIGVDLRDDWLNALRDNGFEWNNPTAWSAEGLLVYLPPDAQDRLLDQVTEFSAAGSRFAAENIPDMSAFTDERSKAWRTRWRRHGLDADVAELVWDGERHPAAEYLGAAGWRVTNYPMAVLHTANGFSLPDHEAMNGYRESSLIVAQRS
jgi:methyltransferase (TIGR00027 family)